MAAKSPPDGYTFLLTQVGTIVINPILHKQLQYDPRKDFAPVHLLLSSPMLLIVHPSIPVRSVKELVALAKSKPGALNYASAGVGNLQHLGMELLLSQAQVKMNHVPYKGVAPALVDLIAGQVDLMFANIVGALTHVKSGRVRAIAIASSKRTPLLPDVPGVVETYSQFDVQGWLGLFAPSGTPPAIITKVNRDLMRVLQLPAMQERLVNQGAEVIAGPPEQLANRIRNDWDLYADLIKKIGLTAD
jgi:tripartite-type tricarboxylate transporter receptor subunit TctC